MHFGELDKAIDYQNKSMEIRRFNNPNDPKLAINYNNLGVFYREKNWLKEAEKWQIMAIETDMQNRGKNHPDVAADLFNYAKLLLKMNRISEAINYLEESREIETSNERIEEIDSLIQQYGCEQ